MMNSIRLILKMWCPDMTRHDFKFWIDLAKVIISLIIGACLLYYILNQERSYPPTGRVISVVKWKPVCWQCHPEMR
jgi:hypothetical protein